MSALESLLERIKEQARTAPERLIPSSLVIPPSELPWSQALDQAYDEYCRLREAGEAVDTEAFCARFPAFRTSLRRLIEQYVDLEAQLARLALPTPLARPAEGRAELEGRFPQFYFLNLLAEGAFSQVYLAAEPAMGFRPVVVKVSRGGSGEATTLGPLSHPNVVPVHSVHKDAATGLTLVCMPYRGSATLATVLDRAWAGPGAPAGADVIREAVKDPYEAALKQLGVVVEAPGPARGSYTDAVVRLGETLAECLAFIHGHGVVHRDLKPSNVLLTPAGEPMLLDFNLADGPRAVGPTGGGTVPYMSPEQLRAFRSRDPRQWAELDGRSDLYSLGVILFELLTGAHPFGPLPDDLSPEALGDELLRRQADGARVPPAARGRLGGHLTGALGRCLEFDPGRRFRSAAELAAALRAHRSPVRRAGRWLGRHARLAAAAALVLAAGLVAAASQPAGREPAAREPASLRYYRQGVAAYREGNFGGAVKWLGRALDEDPKSAPAHFACARAYQAQRQYPLAFEHYGSAYRLTRDARAKAGQAFCAACLLHYPVAIETTQEAIKGGFAPAEVFNNLGWIYLRRRMLNEARLSLDEAIRANDRLQAAYFNRAVLDLTKAVRDPARIPGQGLKDIRKAIQLGPARADQYWIGALLYAIAGERQADRELLKQSLNYLERAVQRGIDPGQLQDPCLAVLRTFPRFQKLAGQPAPPRRPLETARLVDPLVHATP